jgi:hypothetical protein
MKPLDLYFFLTIYTLTVSAAAVAECFRLCGQACLWTKRLGFKRHPVSVQAAGFVIEKIADLDDEPLRLIARDSGDLYICHDYPEELEAVISMVGQLN